MTLLFTQIFASILFHSFNLFSPIRKSISDIINTFKGAMYRHCPRREFF